MSLLQLARCCSCSKPGLPCAECGTVKCSCEGTDPFNTPDGVNQVVGSTIPITSVHIEVGPAYSRSFRSQSTRDKSAWHYMNNLRWRATEFGPRLSGGVEPTGTGKIVNRLVFNAQTWMNGFRFRDKVGRISDKVMPLVLPAGQWGARPTSGLNPRRAECQCLGPNHPCEDDVRFCFCDIPVNQHKIG